MQKLIKRSTISKLFKSCFALFLCFLIVFVSSYKRPVKAKAAVTGTLIVGGIVVAAAAAALGIGCSQVLPTPAYNQACQDIWDHIDSSVKRNVNTMQTAGSIVTGFLSSEFLHAVVDGFNNEYPPASADFSKVNDALSFAKAMGWDTTVNWARSQYSWNSAIHFDQLSNFQVLQQIDWNGQNFSMLGVNVTCKPRDSNGTSFNVTIDNSECKYTLAGSFTSGIAWYSDLSKYALVQAYNKVAGQYMLYILSSNGGFYEEFYTSATSKAAPPMEPTKPDVFNPADENFFAQGLSAMNTKVDDVISRVASAEGVLNGIQVYLPPIVGTLTNINDQIKSLTQSQVTQKDVATPAEKAADDTTNKGRDTTVPKNPDLPDMTIPQAITRKFPFSIPWDLYNSVLNLASPGAAPKFVIPMNSKLLGNNSITIDLSQYDGLAALVRWGLSLLFIIGLILLTNKVIKH